MWGFASSNREITERPLGLLVALLAGGVALSVSLKMEQESFLCGMEPLPGSISWDGPVHGATSLSLHRYFTIRPFCLLACFDI